jgi:hypothetical protein
MKREYIAKLNAWYHEEVDALKAKGATEALFVEPVFVQMVMKKLLENHSDEIDADPQFREEVSFLLIDNASPSVLRKMAAQLREQGDHDLAYSYEVIADQRERGNWTET